MSALSDDSTPLEIVGIAIGGVVSLALVEREFSLWESMVGIILLALLWRHTHVLRQGLPLRIAYAGTGALCLITTIGVVLDWAINFTLPIDFPSTYRDTIFFSIWCIITLLITFAPFKRR
jgi:hypothetical protein